MSRRRLAFLLRAVGALAALAVAGAASPSAAQDTLADTTAWERLGSERQQMAAIGFSGDRANPTIWAGGPGLYRLDRIDGSWINVHLFPTDGVVFFLNDPFSATGPDTVFAGQFLYRSVDGGRTFEKMTTDPEPEADGAIRSKGAFTQFPLGSPYPGRLVSGDSPAPIYSDDGGDSWTRAEASPQHFAFRVHTFRSGRVLAVGFYGAALSDDEGDSWREIHAFEYGGIWGGAATVPEAVGGGPGWAVAVDPPGLVYATEDGGETWVEIGQVPGVGPEPDGSRTRAKMAEVGPDGRLYVGTVRNGPKESWSYRTREPVAEAIRLAVAEEPDTPELPSADLTLRVYPNPTGGTATVALDLSAPERVRVAVYDVQGREVALVHDGPATDGRWFEMDTSGLPAG